MKKVTKYILAVSCVSIASLAFLISMVNAVLADWDKLEPISDLLVIISLVNTGAVAIEVIVVFWDDLKRILRKKPVTSSGMGGYMSDLPMGETDNIIILDPKTELREGEERRCRICGCTWNNACVTDGEPCYWIEEDLCSACVSNTAQEEESSDED